jgi:hypothetical protein
MTQAAAVPLVSVVVPNFNHRRFLRQRIDSILAQSFGDYELILLDDCSTDDSRQILKSYADHPRVKLNFNEANSGSTFKQWNKGASLASGKYLWLAESDDFAAPQFLQKLVPLLESNAECSLAYCQSYDTDENGQVRGILPQWISYPDPRHWDADFIADGRRELAMNFVWGTPIQNASAALIRRSAFVAVGGADPSYRLAGDWKLYIDLLLGGDLAFCAEPMNYFRRHTATVRTSSRSSGLNVVEDYRIFAHLRDHVPLASVVIRRRLNQLARLRAETTAESKLSQDRLDEIADAVYRIDHYADLRFANALMMAAARKTARRVRSMLRNGEGVK